MTVLWSNNATTTISGAVTAFATLINLSPGTGILFPNPSTGDYFVATIYDAATKTINEIVHVTHRSSDACTVIRGQEGTTPHEWSAGDIFSNLITAGTLRNFVQAGTGAADTSIIYAGTDTSGTPNYIVADTNPIPSALAVGMQFNIRIANTISAGAVHVILNGGDDVLAKRSDGSNFIGGDLVAGKEYIFIYDGVYFSTTQPAAFVPIVPSTDWYVDYTHGTDSPSKGLSSGTGAFKTIQYAINYISGFFSSSEVKLHLANDTYVAADHNFGAKFSKSLINSWHLMGASIGGTIIDASATGSIGIYCGTNTVIKISNLTSKAYLLCFEAQGAGASMECYDVAAILADSGCVAFYANSSASLSLLHSDFGNTTSASFSLTGVGFAAFQADYNSNIGIAYNDINQEYVANITFSSCNLSYTVVATHNSIVNLDGATSPLTFINWTGSPIGANRYSGLYNSSIITKGSSTTWIPGANPGSVDATSHYV